MTYFCAVILTCDAEDLPPTEMDGESPSDLDSDDESLDSLEEEEEPSNIHDTNAEQEIEGDFEYVQGKLSFFRRDFLIEIVAL
jgi:hypothetical protein